MNNDLPATTRDEVNAIEAQMQTMPQVGMTVVDHFSPDVYARELHIPAGTVLTGRIHKFANMNMLLKGEISVAVDGKIVRMVAPQTIVSPPGTKRIAYTHTDCIWTTIHGTAEVDVDVIRDHFTAGSEQEYLAYCAHLAIEGK